MGFCPWGFKSPLSRSIHQINLGIKMTEMLYMTDNYLKEFDAAVESAGANPAGENYVVLDKTAFYPLGGGQEYDTGKLSWEGKTSQVTKTLKESGEVRHYLDGEAPPQGTAIHGILDWDTRYDRMRMHTAQHVVSAVAADMYNLQTVGNQLYADRSRIDFYPAHFDDEGLKRLEEESNKIIDQGLDVKIYELPREEADKIVPSHRVDMSRLPSGIKKLRMVEIDAWDWCPCAGTHVASLTELGRVKILSKKSKGADKERIEYVLEKPGAEKPAAEAPEA